MRKVRTIVGRMLVFHTSALPKRIGIPVRRMGRKILFNKKQFSKTILATKAVHGISCGSGHLH